MKTKIVLIVLVFLNIGLSSAQYEFSSKAFPNYSGINIHYGLFPANYIRLQNTGNYGIGE